MVRSNLIRYRISGVDGIDQQTDKARDNSLADARNVWAPDGKVVSRPGYEGVGSTALTSGLTTATIWEHESAATGVFTAIASSPVAITGTNYVLRSTASLGDKAHVFIPVSTVNIAEVYSIKVEDTFFISCTGLAMEYYSASGVWKPLAYLFTGGGLLPIFSFGGPCQLSFVPPADWAVIPGDPFGAASYGLRLTFFTADGVPSTSAGFSAGSGNTKLGIGADQIYGLLNAEFADSKPTFIIYDSADSSEGYSIRGQQSIVTALGDEDPIYTLGAPISRTEAPTIGVNPEFNEAFIATAGAPTVRGFLDPSNDFNLTLEEATVETRDALVGELAAFDSTLLIQDQNWPEARYTAFFRGRLWAAGFAGQPFKVQWSAATPGHRVWPSLNFENLMENDNSPITGMHPLGEHMIVFKQDSIWMMVYNGLNAFSQPTFLPRQVVAGVGCVANSSIQEVRGNLIFLSEDGIYVFDGTPGIKKISDPVADTIRTIDPARRPFSASAHWRKNSLYMLSISTDGDGTTNDTTIIYDYKNNTWWLWDNIDAQHWLVVEGAGDNEELYFGDSKGGLFLFDVGGSDNGAALNVHLTTQRMDYRKNIKRRVRQIELTCSNKTTEVTYKVLPNDTSPEKAPTHTLPFTTDSEINWVDLDWGAGDTDSWSAKQRRARRAGARVDYDWFQVRVEHNLKDQPFELGLIDVGAKDLGRR